MLLSWNKKYCSNKYYILPSAISSLFSHLLSDFLPVRLTVFLSPIIIYSLQTYTVSLSFKASTQLKRNVQCPIVNKRNKRNKRKYSGTVECPTLLSITLNQKESCRWIGVYNVIDHSFICSKPATPPTITDWKGAVWSIFKISEAFPLGTKTYLKSNLFGYLLTSVKHYCGATNNTKEKSI